MRKLILLGLVAVLSTSSAFAYNIRHSYSTKANSTEFYGLCKDGKKFKLIEQSNGVFVHAVGKNSVSLGRTSLDDAAKKACGE